jgi:hypothetical protein
MTIPAKKKLADPHLLWLRLSTAAEGNAAAAHWLSTSSTVLLLKKSILKAD